MILGFDIRPVGEMSKGNEDDPPRSIEAAARSLYDGR